MRAVVLILLSGILVAAQTGTLDLRFWPGKRAVKDPRYLSMEDHPCGKVAIARVSALPGYSVNGALVPELAVEVDANGKVVRRWPMPVNSYPLALHGGRLLLATGSLKFWVDSRGAITRYTETEPLPEPKLVPCKRTSTFGNSAYVECRAVRDLSSGRDRIIQFEAPCT